MNSVSIRTFRAENELDNIATTFSDGHISFSEAVNRIMAVKDKKYVGITRLDDALDYIESLVWGH